jgi:hypothetical protein
MTSRRPIMLTVNGKPYTREVEPRQSLVDFLRDELGLTGTHVGCEQGVCGACTIRLNGTTVRSCLLFAVQANRADVLTVEGLAGLEPSLPAPSPQTGRGLSGGAGDGSAGDGGAGSPLPSEGRGAGGLGHPPQQKRRPPHTRRPACRTRGTLVLADGDVLRELHRLRALRHRHVHARQGRSDPALVVRCDLGAAPRVRSVRRHAHAIEIRP